MPGMNGYEFAKKVKETGNQAKIVLMSAFEINDYKELHKMHIDIKIDGLLQKPFSMVKLNDVLEKIS
jgi:two-component SAPR family response regulator